MPSSIVRLLFERSVSRSRVYRVYRTGSSQGHGRRDDQVSVYDADSPPLPCVRSKYLHYVGRLRAAPTLWRLRHTRAVMLAMMDGGTMIGYGWLQAMHDLRREFWWLRSHGTCLGPYWTHPEHRGRGIYGRLLAHSLFECHNRAWSDLFIWAEQSNRSSIRGIERAGFVPLGAHRVITRLFGLIRRHETLEDEGVNELP